MSTLVTPRTVRHSVLRAPSAELCVRREGIRFQNRSRDLVQIEIEVENRGPVHSAPESLTLEAAPLGAFVRWRPLTQLVLPSIPPGGTAIVRTLVPPSRPRALGGFSGLVSPELRTAAGAPERGRPAPAQAIGAAAQLLLQMLSLTSKVTSVCELPADLMALLDHGQPHWAGNLNVWIQRKAVERHAARLRIHADRPNLAMFLVGDRADQYSFRLVEPRGWKALLFDVVQRHALHTSESEPLWHPFPTLVSPQPLMLVVRPPANCTKGAVEVQVTQRSSGKTVRVEFDLDPAAAGSGCYTL